EQPFNTIQAGATLAGTNSTTTSRIWNVYSQGGTVYAENVLATTGSVNFISSGRLIAGQGGKSFGTGDVPTVAGGISAANIPSLGVTSYVVTGGGGGVGVGATNVNNLLLDEVTAQGVLGDGISINGLTGTGSLIDVTVNGAIGAGVRIQNGNPAAVLAAQNLDVSGANGTGLAFVGASGTFAFDAESSISGTNGTGLAINGGDVDVVFNGDIAHPNSGPAVQVSNGHTGEVTFQNGTVSATGGAGLSFFDADGTYRFLGTTTLTGGASVDISNGSDGTFAFGTGTSITDSTSPAFLVDGGASVINFAGNITDSNDGFAVQISNHSGNADFNTGTIVSTGGMGGIQMFTNSGVYGFDSVTVTGSAGSGIAIANSALSTTVFDSVAIAFTANKSVTLINAGTVTFLGGSINGTAADGIFSVDTVLTVSNLTIGNNTALTTPARGIAVENTNGVARIVSISNTSMRAQGDAFASTDSGVAGELTLILNGNTYESTTAGGKAINVVGSGLDSTTIRSMNGGTVIGNGVGGGVLFDQVTFDGDAGTIGNQAVAAGNWNIGQGTGNRVNGDGLRFDAPSGEVAFGTLNIFNDSGTGLYVDTKTLGTTFTLNNTGGSVNTTSGSAMFLDPLTVNLTFASVSSTNSNGSGIYLDEVAGTLNLGNVTITNSANAAYVQEDSTVAVTAGTVNITNAGGDGMVFNSASGSFTAGATTISGFNGTGVNFTGSGVAATFGVTTISNALNGNTGTGIDLSN
ncbi:MAG: beta strand repeat-containing protein, partial [Roseimicrobium sp.]